jgi:hypothetical protein
MPAVLPDVAAAIVRLSRAVGVIEHQSIAFRPVPGLPLVAFAKHCAHETREWFAVLDEDAAAVAARIEAGDLTPDDAFACLYDDAATGEIAAWAAAALGAVIFEPDGENGSTAVHPCAAALTAACAEGRLLGWCAEGYAVGVTVPAEHPDAARVILAPLGYVLRAERPAEQAAVGAVRQTWIFSL